MNKRLLLITTLLSGCSLAPDFKLPEMDIPALFKEERPQAAETAAVEKPQGVWAVAQPLEKEQRGKWWKIFGDKELNQLEKQAMEANQDLAAATARVESARATVRASASSFLPNIDLGGNAVRAQPSAAGLAAFGGVPGTTLKPYTLYSANGVAYYEADLFGRVRDNEKALTFDADAQEASYRSVMLALQADVAQHYFSLKALDAERVLLRETVGIRKEANRIMKRRLEAGAGGEDDLKRTESELASTEAELTALERQRASLEHALAVLLGQVPSSFAFAESPLTAVPPKVPGGLPSQLLLRRPDIAASTAQMAAANARIGVARTAFFPILTLNASGGFEATDIGDIFAWTGRTWALGQLAGPALTWNIFESGRTIARVDAADANYKESVANYRQSVLTAIRDVEDTLADQRLLAEQSEQQNKAASAASRTTELAQKRFDEGEVNYFEVVDAQRVSLGTERAAVQTRGARFVTTIALIRALGGGWEAENINPESKQ